MIENFRMRVFRAVAQHLNFSRAAEDLLLTQPAVTQQIKALEDQASARGTIGTRVRTEGMSGRTPLRPIRLHEIQGASGRG